MSGELNEISAAIGRLEAFNIQGANERRVMAAKIDTLLDRSSEVAARTTAVEKDVAALQGPVDDWKRTKQRGVGYLAGASIGGAGVLAAIEQGLKKLGIL